ncbi:hypothetical protein JB92DRAFT_1473418 [Gautieria morchelliformis]|nr:hypothetical protein JB92DRAFT_1473418 [Gautieria morchelliformis]
MYHSEKRCIRRRCSVAALLPLGRTELRRLFSAVSTGRTCQVYNSASALQSTVYHSRMSGNLNIAEHKTGTGSPSRTDEQRGHAGAGRAGAGASTSERKLSVELPWPRQIYTVGSCVSGLVHLGTKDRDAIQEVQVSLVCVVRSTRAYLSLRHVPYTDAYWRRECTQTATILAAAPMISVVRPASCCTWTRCCGLARTGTQASRLRSFTSGSPFRSSGTM